MPLPTCGKPLSRMLGYSSVYEKQLVEMPTPLFIKPLIRAGTADDAQRLSALAMQVWLHTYATQGVSSTIAGYVQSEFSTERFQSLLFEQSSRVLVAELNNHLIGYAVVKFDSPCPEPCSARAELSTLYVQAPFAGQGLGASLLKAAESCAMQLASCALWLTVNAQNTRAMAFYAKHGYAKIGITQFRLGDADHDNWVLLGQNV